MTLDHLDAVLVEAETIGRAFTAAGHRVFLVGGIVRDLWLGQPVDETSDLDLTTDALPDETKAVVGPIAEAVWLQGERFGTIGAQYDGRAYEITTHRREQYDTDSRKPDVAYATAIDADLSRRDFTVNAMAIELPGGELIDPFGGANDLAAKVLRTPLDPEVSFTDDPLRVLRAARFVARYDLAPVPELVAAARSLAHRMEIVSVERIREELDKLLGLSDPVPGLEFLAAIDVLDWVLPGAHHDLVMSRRVSIAGLDADAELRVAALLVGQPAGVAGRVLRHLKYPNERIAATRSLVASAEAVRQRPVSAPDYRRWHHGVGARRAEAHALAMIDDPRNASIIGEMETRRLELGSELDDFELPLDGKAIMELLGITEGRSVGAAVDHLREHRFEHGPITAAEATGLLQAWWATTDH